MPSVGSRTVQAKETVGGTTFKNFVNVQAYSNGWKPVKKMFVHNGSGWTEVWNNRPVTTTGTVTSSAYDRLTATGTVDPNNFDSTPRFFYKKNSASTYTQDSDLTVVSGDGAQSVGNRTITGLTENTTYNVYLSATNAAGTSDVPSVVNVTTPYDCRTIGDGLTDQQMRDNGWSASTTTTSESCGTCGTRNKTVTTYTKTGCVNSPYSVTSYSTCIEASCGCASPSTNGWSATQTEYRTVGCGTPCYGQTQYRQYITKTGCTDVETLAWTDTGSCTDQIVFADPMNYPIGWSLWMDDLFGVRGARWVVVGPDYREFGGFGKTFTDGGNICYSCNPCYFQVLYTVVYCPVTGQYWWYDKACV